MTGGLMQLVAYGAQDIYLTGNPQITCFKVVYRRHTNFAVESIEQTYNGSAKAGGKVSVTVSRNGDLLSRVWLAGLVTGDGDSHATYEQIEYAECEIGGQIIDKQYSEWMQMWVDLTHNYDSRELLKGAEDAGYLPLQFWFCRNPGLALPLIALQYREVKIIIAIKNDNDQNSLAVWCDYIFLDTDERRRFAQVSHEYLIEQTQFSNKLSASEGTNQIELRFNHPVKELVWKLLGPNMEVKDALLQLNGHDRFKRRDGAYFTKVQRYQHHTGSQNAAGYLPHVYSFALKPEEHQPSGTCNFSRIDNAVLNFTAPANTLNISVYAVNYNVLRIMSGMGGLAYSN